MKRLFKILKTIDKYKIEKFFLYCRTESITSVVGRIKNYINQYDKEKLQDTLILTTPKKLKNYTVLIAKSADNPLVSIVIFADNQWEYTYNCIKKIIENTGEVNYEIIVADNCSTDKTKQIDKYIKNIVVNRSNKKESFSCICNKAAKKAKGQYIQILSQRTSVQKKWLTQLLKLAEHDSDVGTVGSKMIYPTGKIESAGGIVWKDGSLLKYGILGNRDESRFNYVKEVDYISFMALLIKKDIWIQINGFDERYKFSEYSGVDLAFKVRKKKFKVVYQPLSEVIYFKKNLVDDIIVEKVDQQVFFHKWKSTLQTECFFKNEKIFLARDRSYGKKTVLVIDHYVPHYDCDAGGRCTFQYLKFFVQLGMHVIFLGDNYFQHEPYTTILNQLGIEVLAGDGWNIKKFKSWIKENGEYIDFVYLNRPHISIKYIDMVRERTKAKIIYFGHDLHFVRERRQYEIEKDPKLLSSSEKWKKIECSLFEKADIIHVVGSYEQGILQRMFPNKLIRNIPLYIYNEKELDKCETRIFKDRSIMIFVGGFNHKPNQDAIFWFMEKIYPIIIGKIPTLQFYIIGSHPNDKVKKLASERVFVTGYVTDEELTAFYNKAVVNVIPLRYGAGVKGKVIETLYFGVPAITTTIGAEGLPNIGNCIDIVDDASSYAEHVLRYFSDKEFWMRQSKKEMEYIKANFTQRKAKEILLQDMNI